MNNPPSVATGFADRTPIRSAAAGGIEIPNRDTALPPRARLRIVPAMTAADELPALAGNLPEFRVSELSQAVRRTVEGAFERLRVRGEIGRVNAAASGHLYFAMKEERAVLDCVAWRSTAARLAHRPEEGLEMVATGRLTTWSGQSKYQLVVESLQPAGIGALMALLERRRLALAAEGLFDRSRKRPLPYLPATVGIVTSPTGAAIRDILHRLRDRFPRHVLLWGTPVQGEGAAERVAAAIRGFNRLDGSGGVARPDLLIVARGGGSVEDLWAFNEEVVVRAAAESAIPLVSAIGHESDTTLLDHAADRRAATPTAAAEMAVPVRADLEARLLESEARLLAAASRLLERARGALAGLARGLAYPARLLERGSQDLDNAAAALRRVMALAQGERRHRLDGLARRLIHPRAAIALKRAALARAAAGLSFAALAARLQGAGERLQRGGRDLEEGIGRRLDDRALALAQLAKLLESLSYRGVLRRGFVVVRSEGRPIARAAGLRAGAPLALEFADGEVAASARPGPPAQGSGFSSRATATLRGSRQRRGGQGELFRPASEASGDGSTASDRGARGSSPRTGG